MKTSIPALPQQTVYVPRTLQEAGSGQPANREIRPAIDTAPGNFQTALNSADANNLPKINGSGVSLLKLPQEAPVTTPAPSPPVISTSAKNPGVTAAAMGLYAKKITPRGSLPFETCMPAKDGAVQSQSSSKTAAPPSTSLALSDPLPVQGQPTPASPSSALTSDRPVVQQLEPEPSPDLGTTAASTSQNTRLASRPAHVRDNARSDAASNPAETDRATKPSCDMAAVIAIPPVPYVPIPVPAPALPGTAVTSSRVESSSRPPDKISNLDSAQPSGEDEPVTVLDATNVGHAAPRTAGPDTNAPPERQAAVVSGPRQAAAAPRSPGIVEPALHHAGNEALTRLLSMTTSESNADAGTTSPAAVGSLQVDPGLSLSRDSPPPIKAAASVVIGSHTQAATQQVLPALVSLGTHADGRNELTILLHPQDLGQVEVHLVRGNDGTTAVTITANNPATLQELSQNVHHLHAALDAASVPTDGRTMSFVTTPAPAAEQNQSLSGRGASSSQDSGGGTSGGQERNSWQNQQNSSTRDAVDDTAAHRDATTIATRRTWQLNGLNITA